MNSSSLTATLINNEEIPETTTTTTCVSTAGTSGSINNSEEDAQSSSSSSGRRNSDNNMSRSPTPNEEVQFKRPWSSSLTTTTSINSSENGNCNCFSSLFPRLNIFKYLLIEPVCLLQGIAGALTAVIWQNFYIDRICHVSYNFSDEICANLTHFPEKEKLVESSTSMYTMYQSLIETGFPIIISLFLGPWMDKYGAKPIIAATLIGWIINSALRILLTFLPTLPPVYFLLTSIPVGLTGSYAVFIISTFSFMSNHTSLKSRTFRLAFLGVIWDLGGPIGLILGDLILKQGGYLAVFTTATVIYIVSLIYAMTILPGDVPEASLIGIPDTTNRSVFNRVFNCTALMDTISTYFRKRPGAKRSCLILLTISICLNCLSYTGAANFKYLYTRNKFGWDTDTYSDYATIHSLLSIIGGNLLIFISMKFFKLSDIAIGLFSCASNLAGSLIFTFASFGWQMYLGSSIQMFGSIITFLMRAIISKCIPTDEFGKVFCLVTCFELISPFLSGPLFSFVYTSTISVLPGAIFLVCAGALVIEIINFIYVFCAMRFMDEALLDNVDDFTTD